MGTNEKNRFRKIKQKDVLITNLSKGGLSIWGGNFVIKKKGKH